MSLVRRPHDSSVENGVGGVVPRSPLGGEFGRGGDSGRRRADSCLGNPGSSPDTSPGESLSVGFRVHSLCSGRSEPENRGEPLAVAQARPEGTPPPGEIPRQARNRDQARKDERGVAEEQSLPGPRCAVSALHTCTCHPVGARAAVRTRCRIPLAAVACPSELTLLVPAWSAAGRGAGRHRRLTCA